MIRLEIEGGALDLSAKINLQFKRQNEILAFNNLQVSRTTSFTLPATANNRKLLTYCNNLNEYGDFARGKVAALLTFDSIQLRGNLYVGKCTSDEFECIFTFGDMLQLQALNETGSIFLNPTHTDYVNYMTSTVQWTTTNASAYFRALRYATGGSAVGNLPSVRMRTLIQYACADAGLNVDLSNISSDDGYTRLLITSANGAGATGSIKFSNKTTCVITGNDSRFSQFFSPTRVKVGINRDYTSGTASTYTGRATFYVNAVQVKAQCTLVFSGIPTGVALCKYVSGWTEYDQQCWEDLDYTSGDEIELASGTIISLINLSEAYMVNKAIDIDGASSWTGSATGWFDISGGQWRSGFYFGETTATVGMTVDDTSDLASGHRIYLQNNLPDVTYTELLQSYAALNGKMLAYDSVQERFYFTDLTDYTVKELTDTNVISVKSIERCYGDFAQHNLVTFADDDDEKNPVRRDYAINNLNLDYENKFVEIPFYAGSESASGSGGSKYQLVTTDDCYILAAVSDRVQYNVYYSYRPRIKPIPTLEALCTQSTSVQVKVLMTAADYFGMKSNTAFGWHGCVWFWTEGSWSDGVAEFKLSKYK